MFKFSQKNLRKLTSIFLSFLIPVLIMTSYFAYRNMFPFGNSSLLTVDLGQQYVDFFKYYQNEFGNWQQMMYSFSNGYGNSMLGTWTYYLMSPLNLILLLFKSQNLNLAIFIITILKYGLSGASFAYLINKDNKITISKIYIPIFSSIYALNGWIIANQLNIMWLDGMIFLPLIVLGINKIIEHDSCKTYIISLSIMIMINYYIAYMLCIFSALYFGYKIILEPKDINVKNKFKTIKNFIISSITAVAIDAWTLIPTIAELANSKGSHTVNDVKWHFEYFPLNMIGKFFNGAFDFSQMPSGTPNVFVGCIVCILFISYFFNNKIKLKNRILNALLTLFLIISMCFEPLDLLWHAMQFPIWYPYRFSFIFCFWMIYTSLINWSNISNKFSIKLFIKTALIILVALIYVGLNINNFKYLSLNKYTTSLLLVGITLILFVKFQKDKKIFKFLFILIAISDMSINVFNSLNSISYVSNTDYIKYNNYVNENINELKKYNSGFYRIAKTFFRTKDDPLELNYYGGSTFNSMLSPETQAFANNMGMPNTSGSIEYSNGTIVSDAILGYRYVIDDPYNNLNMAQKIGRRYDINIYNKEYSYKLQNLYNPYALSLIFSTKANHVIENNSNSNPILYQNKMFNMVTRKNTNIFKKLNFQDVKFDNIQSNSNISNAILNKKNLLKPAKIRIYYTLPNNSVNYLNFSQNMNQKNCSVSINNQNVVLPNDLQNNLIVSMPKQKNGYIDINLKNSNNLFLQDFSIYSININTFKRKVQNIKKYEAYDLNIKNNIIKAEINNAENKNLFTTIPYDKNWNLFIDGHKTKIKKWNNYFIATTVNKGHHYVELKYINHNIYIGIMVTMGSSLATLIYYCIIKKRLK
ncbi:YfhO family protein [Apilactobacillus xinyiensis]|uniref:YfhO family protein n=1 Tax=Apilactobacillus xinyiensis TaxID=2841032 RepID=UPI00200FD560|nr:YfhO family protein [Apilactobacillus xinyiensis]